MHHAHRPYLALTMRVGSAMLFATLMVLVKLAGESGVALPEIMFWRQAIPAMLILLWLSSTGRLARLRTLRLKNHGLRALMGTFSMGLGFTSAIMLPLAESTTFGFTAPLFAVLFAGLFVGEKVGPWRWTAVTLGFLGVVIIAQPSGTPISPVGAAAALVAAFTVAIINFQIRDLGRTEDPLAIVFYFAMFGSMIAAPALPFAATAHGLHEWLLLIGIGAVGLVAQVLMTGSLRYAPVATVIVMDYTALVWATLYGWLIWDRFPTAATWLGAPLIVAAGLTIAWRERRLAKQPSPVSATELD